MIRKFRTGKMLKKLFFQENSVCVITKSATRRTETIMGQKTLGRNLPPASCLLQVGSDYIMIIQCAPLRSALLLCSSKCLPIQLALYNAMTALTVVGQCALKLLFATTTSTQPSKWFCRTGSLALIMIGLSVNPLDWQMTINRVSSLIILLKKFHRKENNSVCKLTLSKTTKLALASRATLASCTDNSRSSSTSS